MGNRIEARAWCSHAGAIEGKGPRREGRGPTSLPDKKTTPARIMARLRDACVDFQGGQGDIEFKRPLLGNPLVAQSLEAGAFRP